MSKRDYLLYVEDILDSIEAIKEFVKDLQFEDFLNDRKTYSAVLREYIVIGEAVSKIIDLLESKYPAYQWRMIKDFRNIIVHEYFGVDNKIVWDLTVKELDELKRYIIELKKSGV